MSGPQDAITRIQALAAGLGGMKEAPAYPPESLNQFPFSLCYLRRGESIFEAGWRKDLWVIHWEIFFARQLLNSTVEKAMPYGALALAALQADPTLNGTVSTIVASQNNPAVSEFGWLEYGSQTDLYLGWRFIITVKQEPTL